jgi:hypothetical protein
VLVHEAETRDRLGKLQNFACSYVVSTFPQNPSPELFCHNLAVIGASNMMLLSTILRRTRQGSGRLTVARLLGIGRLALLLRLGCRRLEALFKVGDDVVYVFCSDTDANEVLVGIVLA